MDKLTQHDIELVEKFLQGTLSPVEEKEFNKIMLSHGSKMGIDAVKGEKSQSRTKVMDKIKTPIP